MIILLRGGCPAELAAGCRCPVSPTLAAREIRRLTPLPKESHLLAARISFPSITAAAKAENIGHYWQDNDRDRRCQGHANRLNPPCPEHDSLCVHTTSQAAHRSWCLTPAGRSRLAGPIGRL